MWIGLFLYVVALIVVLRSNHVAQSHDFIKDVDDYEGL
jgi:hypothetical protein